MAGYFLKGVTDLTPLQINVILIMEDLVFSWKVKNKAMLVIS